jgi:hypothetical protein
LRAKKLATGIGKNRSFAGLFRDGASAELRESRLRKCLRPGLAAG